jgi:uncharacterized protein
LSLALLSTGCVGRFLYYPDRAVYQTPSENNLKYEVVSFRSADGTALSGWFVPASHAALGTIIHFHGNAQNMSAHFAFVDWLPAEGFNLFVFDYRGYGRSQGRPNRQGVYEDGLAAVEYVRRRPDVDPDRLVLFGQSLGGANALAVIGERRCPGVKAVVIESAFFSYRSVVRDKIGAMPVIGTMRWPLSLVATGNSHSPGAVVKNIAPVPLLLIHGTADRVIPYHHATWLLERAREPKTLWTVEGADHTEAFMRYGDVYRPRLVGFLRAALAQAPPADTQPAQNAPASGKPLPLPR